MTSTDNPIDAVRARLDGGRKWCKGGLWDEHGGVCLLGGISDVSGTFSSEYFAVHLLLGEVIREQYPDRVPGALIISTFNNHPDTVWADIVVALEKTALRWDEQVSP